MIQKESRVRIADNTGARYNDDHTIQHELGHGPILAQVVVADVALETSVAGMKVSAVNTEGMLVGPAPETYSDGVLRFSLGGPFASIYYLIQKA